MITASAALTTSSVSGFGNSFDRSTPTSAIASTAAGLISIGRVRAGGADVDAAVRELVEEASRHLAAPRVVDADEQHLGNILRHLSLRLGQCAQPLAREPMDEEWHEVVKSRS